MAQNKIRNIAIIAHVDHGKTTLVDAFLKQSNLFRENQAEMQQEQILDVGELEKEKGITIKAKNIAIQYNDYKINIIDTPGHADFGGEVERTLNMADGCLLLVDAQEGPMPQTKFVLKKALEMELKPIVVINKIDKKHTNIPRTLNRIHDLFLNLATDSSQLEFPVFYSISREGKVFKNLPEGDLTVSNSLEGDLQPLLEEIIKEIPAPVGDTNDKLQMLISTIEFDQHEGKYLIGKILRGKAYPGQDVAVLDGSQEEAKKQTGKIKRVMVREGLDYKEVQESSAGDIVAIVGVDSLSIGGTLCDIEKLEALPKIEISSPSVQMKFEASTSPLAGKEGKYVTARLIQQRLEKEIQTNVSLKISKSDSGSYYVAGRGELQLSILIETLRREEYEFQVRKPEIVLKEIDGKKHEPLEELVIDAPEEYIGGISTELAQRKGELLNMETEDGQTRITYRILTRNMFGLRNTLLTITKGNAIINSYLDEYIPYKERPELFRNGALVASDPGFAKGYALNTIQDRGDLFIKPSEEVYEGMIVGINKYEGDLDVNVTKERHKSGVRIKHDEITQTALKPTIPLTLDFALGFIAKDEVLEVTPKSLRLRKAFLTKNQRAWSQRKNLSDFAKRNLGME
ncbi:GTP-binding protein [Candidatus Dojkabacteria bacterium]|nr:GTP-binding protein [Candidatus Dojkabacteria bacterium]